MRFSLDKYVMPINAYNCPKLSFRSTLTGTGVMCITQTCISTIWKTFGTPMLLLSSEMLSLPSPVLRRVHP